METGSTPERSSLDVFKNIRANYARKFEENQEPGYHQLIADVGLLLDIDKEFLVTPGRSQPLLEFLGFIGDDAKDEILPILQTTASGITNKKEQERLQNIATLLGYVDTLGFPKKKDSRFGRKIKSALRAGGFVAGGLAIGATGTFAVHSVLKGDEVRAEARNDNLTQKPELAIVPTSTPQVEVLNESGVIKAVVTPAASPDIRPTGSPTATKIPESSPTPLPIKTAIPTPEVKVEPTLTARQEVKKEVAEQNISEYLLGELVEHYKQKRRDRVESDPAAAGRIDTDFIESDSIFTLYLGTDETRERLKEFSGQGLSRSDVIMLTAFNPHNLSTVAINFNRDLVAKELTSNIDQYPRINGVNASKFDVARRIIEDATRLPVDNIVLTNIDFMQGYKDYFDGDGNHQQGLGGIFESLFPDGLMINNPYHLRDTEYPLGYGKITVDFPEGEQVLDGWQLTQYARTRHQDSDFGRNDRQKRVLSAVGKQLLPQMAQDFAKGNTYTLDKIIFALERQTLAGNLFYEEEPAEILKGIKDKVVELRSTPWGMLKLAALFKNSSGLIKDLLENRDGMFNTFNVVDYLTSIPGTYMYRPRAGNLNAGPDANGNYLSYWGDEIPKTIKAIFTQSE